MYYRRGEPQMSAYEFEYDFAKEEGIEFRFFCAPKRVFSDGERVIGLEFVKTRGGSNGSPRLEIIEGSEFIEPCDTIISAIGQSRMLASIEALGVEHDGGVVRVDDTMRTTREGIFAAGDCIFEKGQREAMVVEAAEQGKIAARSINEYLGGPSTSALRAYAQDDKS
jgi:dihydropyrimidine dehydrogenase (NAD+) subunit PreT